MRKSIQSHARRSFMEGAGAAALLTAIPEIAGAVPRVATIYSKKKSVGRVSLKGIANTANAFPKSGKLGTTDTPYCAMSIWLKGSCGPSGQVYNYIYNWTVADIVTNMYNGLGTGSENSPGFNYVFDNHGTQYTGGGTPRINLGDASAGTNGHQFNLIGPTNYMYQFNDVWSHHMVFYDLHDMTNPLVALYINGVQQTLSVDGAFTPPTGSFSPNAINNTRGMGIPGDGGIAGVRVYEWAQFLFDTQASLFVGGVIPQATLKKFYNNGPVNFGATGGTPIGQSSAQVFLNGPASSVLTNLGSSTATWAATATGTAGSQTPVLYDSPYGPNQSIPARPTRRWTEYNGANYVNSNNLFAANTSSYSFDFGGHPIAVGDTIILGVLIVEGSNFARTITPPANNTPATGWTWSAIGNTNQSINSITGFPQNMQWFKATAATAIVAGAENTLTVGFTANSSASGAGISWVIFNYGPVSSIVAASNAPAGASLTAPSVTSSSTQATLLSAFAQPKNQLSAYYTLPSGPVAAMLIPTNAGGGQSELITLDEAITTTGSVGARNINQQVGRESVAASILLQN